MKVLKIVLSFRLVYHLLSLYTCYKTKIDFPDLPRVFTQPLRRPW
jgi:hypothetical protein